MDPQYNSSKGADGPHKSGTTKPWYKRYLLVLGQFAIILVSAAIAYGALRHFVIDHVQKPYNERYVSPHLVAFGWGVLIGAFVESSLTRLHQEFSTKVYTGKNAIFYMITFAMIYLTYSMCCKHGPWLIEQLSNFYAHH
jgi:hypothetical protein